jgi:multiple sugar transport system permease protein
MEYQVQSIPQKLTTQKNLRRKAASEVFWGFVFILPQMVGLVAFSLIPLLSVFYLSLTSWDGLGPIQFVGLQNFFNQFQDATFHVSVVNTIYFTLLTVPGTIILSLLIALGLNRVRGKSIYRVIYFMPVVTSPVAIAVIWFSLLSSDFGLINLFLKSAFHVVGPAWLTDQRFVIPSIALLIVWGNLGLNMIFFLAGIQNIPATYSEAARIDGANRFQLFWRVTLPLLTPTLFFVLVTSIISSFQVFDQAFVLTQGGPGTDSYTIVYNIYHQAFETGAFGPATADAVILFVILLVVTLFQFWFQRRWVNYDI